MLPPNELWEKTKEKSEITKSFFDNYFANRKIAYAYKLGKISVYTKPKDIMEIGIKHAPQSFVYVNN